MWVSQFLCRLPYTKLYFAQEADGTTIRITNGIWADYASMAVRTGPPDSGAAGLSMLVVPLLNHPGVTMRRLSMTGANATGTTYIALEDVRVRVDNLIGCE